MSVIKQVFVVTAIVFVLYIAIDLNSYYSGRTISTPIVR